MMWKESDWSVDPGPHMYTERWVSESVDASNLSAWRRPFKRETNTLRLTQTGKGHLPRGNFLNVGPVNYRDHHTWVVVTTPHDHGPASHVPGEKYDPPTTWALWGVPFFRFAGICKSDCSLDLRKSSGCSLANLAVAIRCTGQRRVHHIELRPEPGHGERTLAQRRGEVVERLGRGSGAGGLLRVSTANLFAA